MEEESFSQVFIPSFMACYAATRYKAEEAFSIPSLAKVSEDLAKKAWKTIASHNEEATTSPIPRVSSIDVKESLALEYLTNTGWKQSLENVWTDGKGHTIPDISNINYVIYSISRSEQIPFREILFKVMEIK